MRVLTGMLVAVLAAALPCAAAAADGPGGLIVYSCITNGGLGQDICTVDPATGAVVQLTTDGRSNDFPDWSPDGRQIVFDSFRSTGQPTVQVMDADGQNITRISATDCCDRDFQARWSPDGTRIAFVSTRDGDGEYEIYVMDAAGELTGPPATRLTDTPMAEFGQGMNDWQLTWSADSARIAFVSNRDPDEPDSCDLYVMDAADRDGDGTGDDLTRLTFDRDFECEIKSPSWSPDGRQIAFTSTRSGDYEIWVVNADGSDPRNVTNFPGQDFQAGWSPDGTLITFVSGRDGDYEIYSMPAPPPTGAAAPLVPVATQLTHNTTDDQSPDWQPSGGGGGADRTPPEVRLKQPVDGATYRVGALHAIKGAASDAGSGVAGVEVALRQELAGGRCRWLQGATFVTRACSRPLWLAARGTRRFALRLAAPLPSSTVGEVTGYTAYARATDVAGNRSGGRRAASAAFDVT